jgi:hypothetical protein
MREPDLTLELLGWAALRLHGLEGEAYRRDALIAALEADPRNAARLGKHWSSPAAFIAEVAERTGLLIPDTGRVRGRERLQLPPPHLPRVLGGDGPGARHGRRRGGGGERRKASCPACSPRARPAPSVGPRSWP